MYREMSLVEDLDVSNPLDAFVLMLCERIGQLEEQVHQLASTCQQLTHKLDSLVANRFLIELRCMMAADVIVEADFGKLCDNITQMSSFINFYYCLDIVGATVVQLLDDDKVVQILITTNTPHTLDSVKIEMSSSKYMFLPFKKLRLRKVECYTASV